MRLLFALTFCSVLAASAVGRPNVGWTPLHMWVFKGSNQRAEHQMIGALDVSRVPGQSKAFKYLLFSQQTTEGYCRAHKNCVQDKIRDYWTIHGLWPTNETTWPENCDPSDPFNPDTIAHLRADLDKYWPSVTAENSNSFWSHEWEKHGTCAKELEDLAGEHNYFGYTLQLYENWNLTSFLEKAGIVPDNEKPYESQDIENALGEDLRGRVNIVCEKVHDLAHPVLTEIHFCISKQFEMIDCPSKEQVCNEGPIFYLKTA